MKKSKMSSLKIKIGLVDVDLLNGGTRHPNLALLKIAGFLHDNCIPFTLITNSLASIDEYTRIYMSRVFSFSPMPEFYTKAQGTPDEDKFVLGGTGNYVMEKKVNDFTQKRKEDMNILENDEFFNSYPNKYNSGKKTGIDMARQMPYYHLYDKYVDAKIEEGRKASYYNDYKYYSIGFLTRGCFRHCPFCVNKLEKEVQKYSELEWFLDHEKDEYGRLVRPYIYLWDDNFLASDPTIWRPLLQQLRDTHRPFQFRQGLDERILAESEHGEEIAQLLSECRYHGDFIFAFDNWKDRGKIEKALKIWKHYNPKKSTKFYLFCGFMLKKGTNDLFYKDIWELFQRIKVLMQYGCVGYVMRHEDYKNHELSNLYVQIARWCNQQAFYKKLSFWEFSYRNQSYWEEQNGITNRPKLKTYEEFCMDVENGYYYEHKMCLPLRTICDTLEAFPEHKEELLEMFNYKMENLVDPTLWERK